MEKLLMFFLFLISITAPAQQQEIPSVSVFGEGIVRVVPDKVMIRARIEHEGGSPQEVKALNDRVVNNVLDYLRSMGVPSANVQTEYMSLNKNYDYNTKEYSYTANQAISVELENLGEYENIMSGLLESGLNRIDGIQFRTSKEDQLKSEARRKAVQHAREKASELADGLGQGIGSAIKIVEIENGDAGLPVYRSMEMTKESSPEQSIAPGELEIKARVNVVFQLRGERPEIDK